MHGRSCYSPCTVHTSSLHHFSADNVVLWDVAMGTQHWTMLSGGSPPPPDGTMVTGVSWCHGNSGRRGDRGWSAPIPLILPLVGHIAGAMGMSVPTSARANALSCLGSTLCLCLFQFKMQGEVFFVRHVYAVQNKQGCLGRTNSQKSRHTGEGETSCSIPCHTDVQSYNQQAVP